MNEELKIIKKHYGEKMAHLCRELFPTLLEQENVLSDFLLNHFYPYHGLYNDLVKNDLKNEFQNFIYKQLGLEEKIENNINKDKTVKELFNMVGYDFFECTSNEDIQKFKKYYQSDEQLCTFRDEDRIENYYVFFAVKKNVEEIKRENFTNPSRQDEYGTSAISLQFTKTDEHILSIKNRYNHKVKNPDATFSNNLDNIILGLTEAFERDYGLVQKYKNDDLEIPNYVIAEDGRYYKFNYEINNTYYCPNNITINNRREVVNLSKEKYIVLDYFSLDLKEKYIETFSRLEDSFIDTLQDITRIDVKNTFYGKQIIIKTETSEEDIEINLDKDNRIISYINNNVTEVGNDFLARSKFIRHIEMNNLKYTGKCFLRNAKELKTLYLPNLKIVMNDFLSKNKKLEIFSTPNVISIGSGFLTENKDLQIISAPKLKTLGDYSLTNNNKLKNIYLPSLEVIGSNSLSGKAIKNIFLPNLKKAGDRFFSKSENMNIIYMPKVEKMDDYIGNKNRFLKLLYAPKLKTVGDGFFIKNKHMDKIIMNNLDCFGIGFLDNSDLLKKGNVNLKNFEDRSEYENAVKKLLKQKTMENITK